MLLSIANAAAYECPCAAAAATHAASLGKGSFPWVTQFPSSIIQYSLMGFGVVVALVVVLSGVVVVVVLVVIAAVDVVVAVAVVVEVLVVVISHLQKPAFDEMVPNFLLDAALLNLSRFAAFFIVESM